MPCRYSKISIFFLGISFFGFACATSSNSTANLSDKELAAYYERMAKHYETLAHQYSLKAELNKSSHTVNLPARAKAGRQAARKEAFAGSYAGLGDVFNTGNISSNNLYTKGYLQYQPSKKSLTTAEVSYQNAHQSGKGQLDNRFYADLNSAYNFDGKQGVYGDINYTRDTFSGYDYVLNESIGYNYIVYQTDKYNLTTQVGPGLQEQRIQASGVRQNNPLINLRLASEYHLSEDNIWQETLTNVTTRLNNNTTLESSLTVEIFNKFAVQFDVLLSNDTHPLPGKFGLNSTSTVSIIYNF